MALWSNGQNWIQRNRFGSRSHDSCFQLYSPLVNFRSLLAQALMRVGKIVGGNTSGTAPGPLAQASFDVDTQVLWNQVQSRTMTSVERVDALRASVEYIHANSIPGDIVECGVWRGGSMMAVALTLLRLGTYRRLWLYDTFSGMTPPGAEDMDFRGRAAKDLLAEEDPDTSVIWAKSSLPEVKHALAETGYPFEQIEFVAGPVENTIPVRAPETIALLRLDTDWFESTYHELSHLWPRLVDGGILIVDDYGHWAGARRAVTQYFEEIGLRPLLHRIDETARLVMKRQTNA